MKKNFSLYIVALILLSTFAGTSCKKRIHANAPTPNNVRMLGYTKITTYTPAGFTGISPTVTEKFRFYYDQINRLAKITYTGNDTFAIYKDITFTYKGDTVYKNTKNILTNSIVQRDTFILNSNGLLVTAYTPNLINTYEYYGQLLARKIQKATSHRHIEMTAQSTYTSVNGDFLKNNYDGLLKVDFIEVKTPLTINYYQDIPPFTLFNIQTLVSYEFETHTIANFNYNPIKIKMTDTVFKQDSLIFPGSDWIGESYHFYTEDANRIGDFLQLESFTMYGNNIFRNAHLVESMTSRNRSAYITYNIDAFSKITQTRYSESDSVLNNKTIVYDIQYETF
jgi:hypothetical protein